MRFLDQPFFVRTKKHAAELLGVSRQTVHKWEKDGPIVFRVVGHDWLSKNLSRLPEISRVLNKETTAYIILNIPEEIEEKQRLSRYRGIYLPVSEIPGLSAAPDTRYSLEEAGIRLKQGRLHPQPYRRYQRGYSRSYMYGVMGEKPNGLASVKVGGRRFVTEQAIREYEITNGMPEHKVLLRIYEPDDSKHWEERTPESIGKKAYSSPKVLYFKPFG